MSWAELKLVITRQGMPRTRMTARYNYTTENRRMKADDMRDIALWKKWWGDINHEVTSRKFPTAGKDQNKVRKRVKVLSYLDELTCAHDCCKHPALPVFDWAITSEGPQSQDVPTPSPKGRIHPLFEIPRPVPLQHTPVILTVDLNQKDKCQFPKTMKQG